MTSSQTMQDVLCKKFRMIGLSREETLPLVNMLVKQINAEGPENVVRRLKVLKQAAVNQLAGLPVSLAWIAHNPNGPKGAWKPIWSRLMSSNYRSRVKALNALMVYCQLQLRPEDKPTRSQERKFVLSVEKQIAKNGPYIHSLAEGVKQGVKGLKAISAPYNPKPVHLLSWLYSKNGLSNDNVAKATRQLLPFYKKGGKPGYLTGFRIFPEVAQLLEGMDSILGSNTDWSKNVVPHGVFPVGVVGYTHEPGMKCRFFASPNQVLQASLEPLKLHLLYLLKLCHWDNTHDQEKGVKVVQQWLSEGKTCHSIDLSDATNNFPLALQMDVLQLLGIPLDMRRLFRAVATSPYSTSWEKDKEVKWTVGQPLGSGPSFPLFALTHGLLCAAICDAEGLPSDCFQILGDDFITCNDVLAEKYRLMLQAIHCPVSESKCITSPVCGEFAGKLIFKDNVMHGWKYTTASDLSFMSVLKTLGPRALSRSWLSAEQYAHAKVAVTLPEPWGLGWNPRGLSLASRTEFALFVQDGLSEIKEAKCQVGELTLSQYENRVFYLLSQQFTVEVDEKKARQLFMAPVPRTSGSLLSSMINRNIVQQETAPVARTGGDPRPNPIQVRTGLLANVAAAAAERAGLSVKQIVPTESAQKNKAETVQDLLIPGTSEEDYDASIK